MWLYNNKIFTADDVENYVGFVYRIRNTKTGKLYIGKKLFWNKVTKPPLKGKKRRRISKKQSNWMEYFGSNAELNADVVSNGAESFDREILRLCSSKGEMSYFEAKYQFDADALLSNEYYNDCIICKIHRSHVKK